jgi:hypothetical protein
MTDSLFDLSGRLAPVRGARGALGQYYARGLASAGADVAITIRSKQPLSAPVDEIWKLVRRSISVAPDVRDYIVPRTLSLPSKSNSRRPTVTMSWKIGDAPPRGPLRHRALDRVAVLIYHLFSDNGFAFSEL